MSWHVTSWVMRYAETESVGDRLVLLVIADHASEDGTHSHCSVATLAREARLSVRQVQRCLRRLEAGGFITEVGKGPNGTHDYTVVMGGRQFDGVAQMSPEPSLERETSEVVTHTGGVQGGPKRVDGKSVTAHEASLAADVLDAWNVATGQRLRAKATLGKIIMRLREYPELDLAAHEHIIRVSLERPWWRGTPSPSVIYGNDAQFERQLAEASRSATSEVQSAFDVAMRVLNERSNR